MGQDYAAICADPQRKEKEWQRILTYLNNKYKTDAEFREKKKQYQKDYRERKLKALANLTKVAPTN
jgi:Skp family chaperone for outer membrane proteins